MDNVRAFAEELVAKAGLSSLPEDLKEEKIAEMETMIQNKIGETILANLSDEAKMAYLDLLKADLVPDEQKLDDFLQKNLPDYRKLVADAINAFGGEYLQHMQ